MEHKNAILLSQPEIKRYHQWIRNYTTIDVEATKSGRSKMEKCQNTQRSLGHIGNEFTKKKNVRLQRLQNELLSISQWNMMISQYFSKTRMKRIFVHGIRPEYKSIITATCSRPQNQFYLNLEKQLSILLKDKDKSLFNKRQDYRKRDER
ncbi:hypothetical protein H5410_002252 [Solanum commersonii]|uniref:Uncharacterized protein n=1 Tax=Solanum commersonii TaxID=4109 RepID=A0A9J6B2D7_SOLCO|nr:hypothetical protein H5410_002252 [Solanum commersonii]